MSAVKRARARAAKPQAGPFDGYHRRHVPAPDPELTQVGPGTPCGEYLRRFWQPVAFARDLTATPRRVRILGEDLVVFRDRGGQIGVLHLHCAHRGTSLEFGIPVERGIRCCYHGWVYDVDGRCLATPGEPHGSRLRERVRQGAYPTHEFAGLVFAYLGPPDGRPAFPR
ncbi:MAG: ring-hydroxylating oxygenase subunit alpha, partial [Candidatus Rokuibacteriota bacterium]